MEIRTTRVAVEPQSQVVNSSNGSSSTEDDPSAADGQYRKFWLLFFTLGTINNLAYVIVQSAAQSLAQQFNAQRLLGLIQWANVGFGTLSRAANAFWLLQVPYKLRVSGTAVSLCIGLTLLGVSGRWWDVM